MNHCALWSNKILYILYKLEKPLHVFVLLCFCQFAFTQITCSRPVCHLQPCSMSSAAVQEVESYWTAKRTIKGCWTSFKKYDVTKVLTYFAYFMNNRKDSKERCKYKQRNFFFLFCMYVTISVNISPLSTCKDFGVALVIS